MEQGEIELLSNIDISNEKLPFHYPMSFKTKNILNNMDNQINLEVFYNIYNNYSKNQIKHKNKNNYINQIKENQHNSHNYSQYNNDKKPKNNSKHKYQFLPRKKSINHNLSENVSIKNNKSNIDNNIKNMKYSCVDKNYNINNYIIGSSNNLIKNDYYEYSFLEENISKKKLIHSSSNSNPHYKSLLNDKKEVSNIFRKKNYNSYGKKNEKKNKIYKRNITNDIGSSKSYSLINRQKSVYDRPKSYEFKTKDNDNINNNDIISNYLNKRNEMIYKNKMLKIDKYINNYINENTKKQHISFNKNKKRNKDKKNKNIINMINDYYTDNSIFRKKSSKNKKSEEKESQNNIIFNNYYTSKHSNWKKNKEKNNESNNLFKDKPKKNFYNIKLKNIDKKVYNDIYEINNSNKNKKSSQTIQENNEDNKKQERIFNILYKYQNPQPRKQSETANYFHKNISERMINLNPLNEKNPELLIKNEKNILINQENKILNNQKDNNNNK